MTAPRKWEDLDPNHRQAIILTQDDRACSAGRGTRVDTDTLAHAVHQRVRFGLALTETERAQLAAIIDRLDGPFEPAMRLAQHNAEADRKWMGRAVVKLFSAISRFVARGVEGEGYVIYLGNDTGRDLFASDSAAPRHVEIGSWPVAVWPTREAADQRTIEEGGYRGRFAEVRPLPPVAK